MKVVLIDSDLDVRRELVLLLQRHAIAVESFADPHTAFLYLLTWLDEVDGVFVNDDEGKWSSWLVCRLEMLSASLPVFAYSGQHPERQARIDGRMPRPEPRRAVGDADRAQDDPADRMASLFAAAASSRTSARR